MDYGKIYTNTVQFDAFQNHIASSLNKSVPDDVVKQIWNALDRSKIGRITTREYELFAGSLSVHKAKSILLG